METRYVFVCVCVCVCVCVYKMNFRYDDFFQGGVTIKEGNIT